MKNYLMAFFISVCMLSAQSQAGVRDRALRAFGPVYTPIVCAPVSLLLGYATFNMLNPELLQKKDVLKK